MPIVYDDAVEPSRASLQGACTVEEAETLLAFLVGSPDAAIDASECTHAHAAVVQVLRFKNPSIQGLQPGSVLARALTGGGVVRQPGGTP